MEASVVAPLILILVSSIFGQPRALEYPQELISSINPTTLPSSISVFPTIGITIPQFPPPPLVPALFVIGDSSVDSGTNNFLGTVARADRLPYGRDFDTHRPTGRFSNGRIPVDYLAVRLGLPFVPSYLGQSGSVGDMLHGVNYASAGAGIIFTSGSELGQRISFTQQIQQFTDTYENFVLSMGEQAAADLISNSVFYISIGINDYIHYYLRNVSNVQNIYQPWTFNKFLASIFRQQLKNLYNLKARKMIIMGLPPIGCSPHYLWQFGSQNGECIEEINDMIKDFNFVMRNTIEELGKKLRNSNLIFCDVLEGAMDILKKPESYGFNVTTDACCGLGKYRGWIMCLSPEMACSDASYYIWWDQFHPTDAVNAVIADNVWNGRHSKMCYPFNLEDIVVQKA